MGKTSAPKSTRRKSKCTKCGRSYYQLSEKKIRECSSCNPSLYKSEKEAGKK